MLDKPWVIGSDPTRQPRFQPVEDYTYWPALVSFNNWNIIQFSNITTTSKDFDAVHTVLLYGIRDNVSELAQNGKYGAINTIDPTTTDYYVVKFLSEPYALQDSKPADRKVINSGELIVKPEYLSIMKSKKNLY